MDNYFFKWMIFLFLVRKFITHSENPDIFDVIEKDRIIEVCHFLKLSSRLFKINNSETKYQYRSWLI